MKTITTKIAALMLALCMLVLAGCGADGGDTTSSDGSSVSKKPTSSASNKISSEETSSGPIMPEVNDYTEHTYNLVEVSDYIKVVGRSATAKSSAESGAKPCITFDHTGMLLAFDGDCEGDVTLALTIRAGVGTGLDEHFFLVEVDGVEQRVSVKGKPSLAVKSELKLATGLAKGKHTFKVYRQTELNFGACDLISVTMNGVMTERPADSALTIEFIGDSITAGYGNLTTREDTDNPSYPAKSSGTDTYAFYAAKQLNADMVAVARSGLAYSYGLGQPIEDYWKKISWARTHLGDYKPEKQPDIVVIALGTNDHGNYPQKGYTTEQMYEEALKMLKMVKEDRPDSKIVWHYGMMGKNLNTQIKRAIEEMGGEAKGIYYLEASSGMSGGGWHPSIPEHEASGKQLADFLKTII